MSIRKQMRRILAASLSILLTAGVLFADPPSRARGDTPPAGAQVVRRPDPLRADKWFHDQRSTPGGHYAATYARAVQQAKSMPVYGTSSGFQRMAVTATNKWSNLGPTAIGNMPLGIGPASGRIASMAISGSTIYLGTASGGVWKSTNSGGSWVPLTDNQPSLAIGALAIDPNNSNVVYAATGEFHKSTDSFYGMGILKSIDGGSTWKVIGADVFTGQHMSSIVVDPNNSANLLVAADHGLYRSTDGGSTWTNRHPYSAVSDLKAVPGTSPLTLFAAVDDEGVFRSTDSGATWTPLSSTGLPTGFEFGTTSLAVSGTSAVYALVSDREGDLQGLYVSKDRGDTWSQLTSTPNVFDGGWYFAYWAGNAQGWYDNAIIVNPKNPKEIWIGGIGLSHSTDGGATWSPGGLTPGHIFDLAHDLHIHPDIHAFTYDSAGNLYVGSDGGVWRINTNGTSTDLNNNLAITQESPGLSQSNEGSLVVVGSQDNGTVKYNGSGWTELFGGDGGFTLLDPTDTRVIWGSYVLGEIDLTTDGGAHVIWGVNPRAEGVGDPGGGGDPDAGGGDPETANWIAPMVMDPNDHNTVYQGRENVWVTHAGKNTRPNTWAKLTNYWDGKRVSALAVAPSNSKVLYAGWTNGRLAISSDGGATWRDISPGPEKWITGITVSPTDPYTAYVTLSGTYFPQYNQSSPHVYRTPDANDGLPAWTNITGNLPDAPVNKLVLNGSQLIVASDVGVFTSTNGGASWSSLGTGMPNVQVVDLLLTPGGRLFAATHGRGTWVAQVSAPPAAATTITNIAPSSGSKTGGTTVTITGTNFLGATTVTFGDTPAASFQIDSDTHITAVSPPGGGVVDITVTGSGGISAKTPTDKFTYQNTPVVTEISPASGPAGTPVTISFSGATGSEQLQWSGWLWASIIQQTGSTMTFVPSGEPGEYTFWIVDASGPSNKVTYTITPGPVLTSVTPGTGTVGTAITLTGNGFGGSPGHLVFHQGPQVFLATTSAWSDTTVTAAVPTGMGLGGASVAVENAVIGLSNALPFSVTAPDGSGTLTVSPATVTAGQTGQSLTFSYTAPVGGLSGGEMDITVPAGASAPSTSPSAAGYTTAGTGTVLVGGQTIRVTGLTLASGAKLTVVYGDKSGKGPGATMPTTPGLVTFPAQSRMGTGGALSDLAASPGVAITAAPPATLAVTTTAGANAGGSVNVTVTAKDAYGNMTPGYTGTVHITSSDKGAILPADYAFKPADNGTKTFAVTLKTAGPQTVTVTDKAKATMTGVTSAINVSPAAAVSLVVSAPTSASVGTPVGVTVTAKDAYGNTASGYTGSVHVISTDGQALLPVDYAFQTNDGGSTSLNVTLKTVGRPTVTVTDTANAAIKGISSPITASPAAASTLVVTAPGSSAAGSAVSVTVTAKDAYGNTATNYTGTVHLTSIDGQALLPADYAFQARDNGTKTFAVTLKTAGAQTVKVTDKANGSATGVSSTINVSPAALARLAITAPGATTAGNVMTVTITAVDAYGNPASGYMGKVHITSTDGKALLPADYTFQAGGGGTKTLSVTLKTAGNQTVTVTDTAKSTMNGVTTAIAVSPAAVAKLVVTTPASVAAGTALNVTVTATDAYGNRITDYAGTVHLTGSDGPAVLPADYAFQAGDSGTKNLSVTLKTAGNQTVTATDTGNPSITGVTAAIKVNPGAVASLVVVAPGAARAGNAVTVTVTAKDVYGNTATGYTDPVHLTSSDGKALLPADYTFGAGDSGTKNLSVTLKSLGNQTVTVTDKAKPSLTVTSAVNVGPGVAASLVVTTASSSVTAGGAVSVTVTAKDAYGNQVTNYTGTVRLSSSDGKALLPADYSFQPVDGGSTSRNVTLKTVGRPTVTVTDTANATIKGISSPITVSPAAASTLVVTAPGSSTAGSAVSVTVTAKDAYGNTATNYTGTVHLTSIDGQALLPAAYTFWTQDGGTKSLTVTLKTAGSQKVTATDTADAAITGDASIKVNPGVATGLLVTAATNSATVGQAVSVTVIGVDAYGNTATGYTGRVRFTSSDRNALLPADFTFRAQDSGTKTLSVTLKTAGNQTVTATDTAKRTVTGTSGNVNVGAVTHAAGLGASGGEWMQRVSKSVAVQSSAAPSALAPARRVTPAGSTSGTADDAKTVVRQMDSQQGDVRVVSQDEGAVFTFPQGSLPDGTTITVQTADDAGVSLPTATRLASSVWTVRTGASALALPVQATFHYRLPDSVSPLQVGLYTLENGRWTYDPGAQQADAADGVLIATLPSPGTWAVMVNMHRYSDVDLDFWAFRSISALDAAGRIGGFPDGTFQPDRPITRAEFLRVLMSTLGSEPQPTVEHPFADVPADAWYAGYVNAAYQQGLLVGGGGYARPMEPISRQEVAALLMRVAVARHLPGPGTMPAELPKFQDQQQIAPWAGDAPSRALLFGLMHGYPDGTFRPQANMTRAEVAVVMLNLLQRVSQPVMVRPM